MSGFYTKRYALTSSELTDVVAVRGTVRLLEEKPINRGKGTAPSLYQRRFELADHEVIWGTGGEQLSSFTFSGFTMLAPSQRGLDPHRPTLKLEGQTFFDNSLPIDTTDTLLLLGGPEITPEMGFMGNTASVEDGIYAGQPVRAFLVQGADKMLPQALPSLVGWQAEQTLDTARAATTAAHPLIALDALRIAMHERANNQIELLAQWLLHPTQHPGVRSSAIHLLGEAINQMPLRSQEADTLLRIAVVGWEAERTYQVDAAYLRALQSVSGHVKASGQLEQVKAIADDYHIRELATLSKQLTKDLK
jgi:hypothetical protein